MASATDSEGAAPLSIMPRNTLRCHLQTKVFKDLTFALLLISVVAMCVLFEAETVQHEAQTRLVDSFRSGTLIDDFGFRHVWCSLWISSSLFKVFGRGRIDER